MLAEVQQEPEQPPKQRQAVPGGGATATKRKTWRGVHGAPAGAAPAPPALLLVPPQLVAHGLQLVQRAAEASGTSAPASWRAGLVAQAAALYASCYQALWGAQVLRSAEAYQLLLSVARLRQLLRSGAGGGAAGTAAAAADAEAAAEARLLAHNAVNPGRQRRQRSNAHELPALGGQAGTSSAPPPKRQKTEGSSGSGGAGGGSAVAELLQLFNPAAAGEPASQQQAASDSQGQQQPARKRIMAVPVGQGPQPAPALAQQQQQQQQQHQAPPARKRITPQQVGPASTAAAAGGRAGRQGASAAAPPQQGAAAVAAAGAPLDAPAAAGDGGAGGRGQQRVLMLKREGMSEVEAEAQWAAYIQDKELLAEMLGVSAMGVGAFLTARRVLRCAPVVGGLQPAERLCTTRPSLPCPTQDAGYQAWFDEAAHPLRKQRQRPGGLEAAWAAVLGGGGGASLVRQQLPRSLLDASSSMPWDAAAAACLHLLRALLAPAAAAGEQGLPPLLQHAFPSPLREGGALAAQRALAVTGAQLLAQHLPGRVDVPVRRARKCHSRLIRVCSFACRTCSAEAGFAAIAKRTAAAAPACGSLLLLSVQLLALVRGCNYLQRDEFALSRRLPTARLSAVPGGAPAAAVDALHAELRCAFAACLSCVSVRRLRSGSLETCRCAHP